MGREEPRRDRLMVDQRAVDFSAAIVADIREKKKWVCFGAGESFRQFMEKHCLQRALLPPPAYVCDNNPNLWGTKKCGVPVREPAALLAESADKTVIVVSTALPLSAMEDLLFKLNRHYFFMLPIRQLEAYFAFSGHREEVEAVYRALADDRSKAAYAAFWELTLSGITNYERLYSAGAYWRNDIVPHLRDGWEILYAGAYDGKHIDRALEENERIVFHGFEPNPRMYEGLREKYRDRKQVRLYPYALGSQRAELRLDAERPLSAKILPDAPCADARRGGGSILCTTIDAEIQGKLDLIALDIEGFELEALKGARETIRRHRPTLAICVYHDIRHYTDIPLYIRQADPAYRLFFRHHSVSIYESVLYAAGPAGREG